MAVFPLHLNIYIREMHGLNLQLLLLDGQFIHTSHAQSLTRFLQGTNHTLRRGRSALNGSEVHHGLIEGGRLVRVWL